MECGMKPDWAKPLFIIRHGRTKSARKLIGQFNSSPLYKMTTISQISIFRYIFANEFSLYLEFQWHLLLRVQLTVSQPCLSLWLGAEQATSHYLNQRWPSWPTHLCGTRRWGDKLKLRALISIYTGIRVAKRLPGSARLWESQVKVKSWNVFKRFSATYSDFFVLLVVS